MNSETGASSATATWPRPSVRWQLWQLRALYSGPRPSDDVVELGAEVHSLRKTPLPTLKSSSFSKPMLAEDCEKTERSRVLSVVAAPPGRRSETHTSELQSLMRTSYAVFCLNTTKQHTPPHNT